MNNKQKNQLILQVFAFLEIFVKLGQNDFVNIYLLYFYRVLDGKQPSKAVIKEIIRDYNIAIKVIKEQQLNHVYDETVKQYPIPELLVFWKENDRRIDDRYQFVDKLYAGGWRMFVNKLTTIGINLTAYSSLINYLGEIEDIFYNNATAEDDYYQKHEAKLQFFQLQYLSMLRKDRTNWQNWSFMNEMFRGAYEEVLNIPVKLDSSQIYNLHHFLRQSRGYAENWDMIQASEEAKLTKFSFAFQRELIINWSNIQELQTQTV